MSNLTNKDIISQLSNSTNLSILLEVLKISNFDLLLNKLNKDIKNLTIVVTKNQQSETLYNDYQTNQQSSLQLENERTSKENAIKKIINDVKQRKITKNYFIAIKILLKLIEDKKLHFKLAKSNISSNIFILDYSKYFISTINILNPLQGNTLDILTDVTNRDNSDIKSIIHNSTDITKDLYKAIKEQTGFRATSPFEVYIKFLIEFLEPDYDESFNLFKLPRDYEDFQYQQDAIKDAHTKLQQYNGVIISDVVGLGKTITTLRLLASYKNARILILCPPALINQWEDTVNIFNLPRVKIMSTGNLDKAKQEDNSTNNFNYIVVDEAHRFRNHKTLSYIDLQNICKFNNKKVILLSATPMNNKYADLKNMIHLFIPNIKNFHLGAVKNIEKFLLDKDRKIKKIKQELQSASSDKRVILNNEIKNIGDDVRNQILKPLMIRRTRTDIKEVYKEDIEKNNLSFPIIEQPKIQDYLFSDDIEKLFDKSISVITKLKYARYTPLLYLKNELKANEKVKQTNMKGFIKTILVKRLESSIYAFKRTLNSIIESYNSFERLLNDKGIVVIGKNLEKVEQLIDIDFEEFEKELKEAYTKALDIEKEKKETGAITRGQATADFRKYDKNEFKSSLNKDLKADIKKLNQLQQEWENINLQDNKFIKLKRLLETELKNQKVILFSEAKDTIDYLYKELASELALKVSSDNLNRNKHIIKYNFDPNYENTHEFNNLSKKEILLTTDILSEGVNLHKANVIINYDIPWNPTRVLQRVGRVNRIGTKHKSIYIYNFFPTQKSDTHLNLKDNIIAKMNSFHTALGEDAKYFSDDEITLDSTKKLFNTLTDQLFLDDEAEKVNPELVYRKELEKFKREYPKEYKEIKKLPYDIYTVRSNTNSNKYTITALKQGNYKFLCKIDNDKDNSFSYMDFEEAVSHFKADRAEKVYELDVDEEAKLLSNKDILLNNYYSNFENMKNERTRAYKANTKGSRVLNIISKLPKEIHEHSKLANKKEHIDFYIELAEKKMKSGDINEKEINNLVAIFDLETSNLLSTPESYSNQFFLDSLKNDIIKVTNKPMTERRNEMSIYESNNLDVVLTVIELNKADKGKL